LQIIPTTEVKQAQTHPQVDANITYLLNDESNASELRQKLETVRKTIRIGYWNLEAIFVKL